ncbi:hypothetical protein [Hymenobacter sp. YC55]|uniref:hypothetical protein n=1 Tax=Hymenobacter sp. YC55 TaxID=3034019 RepID=UPI0023F68097|nr:hypothetical protein [Hymenobacter sp. YC55]MDF7810903.1 hypothetical protein [Hymenobacter sp. YC55]
MAIPFLYRFNQLPLAEQLGIVLGEGTYLTMRFGEHGDRINLYHMGTFFAEVYYDPEINHLHHCRTFVSTGPLEAYTDQIRLPSL